MTLAEHPKKYKPCPECGGNAIERVERHPRLGAIYECQDCGQKLFVYDNSDHGMGQSLTWSPAGQILEDLSEQRKCNDCGREWRYTGNADLPTCPDCKGKNTDPIN